MSAKNLLTTADRGTIEAPNRIHGTARTGVASTSRAYSNHAKGARELMTNDSIPDSVYSANNPLYARYRDALLAIRRWLFGNDSAGISDAWIEAYARKIITICEMHGWNLNDQASYEKAVRFDLSTRGLL